MMFRQVLLGGVVAAGLAVSGAGVSAALLDVPQDAVPVQDPVGDALRNTAPPAQPPAPVPPQTPTTTPAPNVTVVPPLESEVAPQEEVVEEEDVVEEQPVEVVEEPVEPGPRRRLPVAIIQAIDKTTAETMRFEVEVGGRPVRFSRSLIFKVRACEVSGPGEQTEDSIAYIEIGTQSRNQTASTEARQVFKGWMFASSPSVNPLQHPTYDAWVVGCKGR
ncbi:MULTISPECIES: DUF2155 domain-containing protein [unclassified Brevundimonas]|uniref:DUF2155 domain-containing protein n=1 Tax=unclassified Brevundimonas TaxID=2622653 RepID=UPI0025BC670F|nr:MULTISPECIES: DUF2155 domain-containing protein [unclassified Brevundimonas]